MCIRDSPCNTATPDFRFGRCSWRFGRCSWREYNSLMNHFFLFWKDTPYSKILRWTRWCNSFFDWEPISRPKNDIYCLTSKNHFWRCHWINVIFWPWIRLPIEKRVAPACSAQNFTIGGMSAQFFYHVPIGFRGASSTKTLIFILQKIRVFQLVAPLKPIGTW